MKITINREACCPQDDQLGPLDMMLEVTNTDDLESLAKNIGSSGFLQYSSSHTLISGYVGNQKILSMSSKYHTDGSSIYHAPKDSVALELIGSNEIFFRW